MSTKVTIKKDKVIKALKATLDNLENHKGAYQKAYDQYEKAQKAFEAKVKKLIKPSTKVEDVSVWTHRDNTTTITLKYEITLPKGLVAPEQPTHKNDWQINQEKEEISSAIKMLEMCEDDKIGMTLYKTIAKYL